MQATSTPRAGAAGHAGPHATLLEPGRNCWRVEHAHRVAFLVDAAEYFAAARAAICRARHSIFLLGWDIDSRTVLVPGGARDAFPAPLGEFLNAVVGQRRGLRAFVLSWDFAMLYALEREWLPVYRLGWSTHRRLHFRLDDCHPPGASHHQKLLVVDDAVAFVGGLDLTRSRWDTSGHHADDPRRVDPDGSRYPPFHDVTVAVDGAAARALGELARDRWQRACGRPPRVRAAPFDADAWPTDVKPQIRGAQVAISRTSPRSAAAGPVQEIKQLYLDALGAAQRHVYLENQYFTSSVIGDALAASLAAGAGPEIALVSRRMESGWLEETTMGVLRARLHARIKESDRFGRFRAYYPEVPGVHPDCLNVHSKLAIFDDTLVTIGSANLNNRSMGLDTECNLAIEAAGDPRVAAAIGGLRSRLLGEHLGVPPSVVDDALRHHRSLHRAIAALRGGERSLELLEPSLDAAEALAISQEALIDPEHPIDPDRLAAELLPPEERGGTRWRVIALALALAALAALAIAWRWTPLGEWLDLDRLIAAGEAIAASPVAPVGVVAAYVIGGLAMIPVTLLFAATAAVFGAGLGALYGGLGALAAAAVGYWVGRRLGRDTIRRLAGSRLNRLSQRLAQRGILAMAVVRVLPIAPFTIVNLVAGASHIGFRDFLIGSAIGLAPGLVALALFVDRIGAAIRDPGPATFATLAALAAAVVTVGVVVNRRLAAKTGGR